jgi:hypothetical protein
MSELAELARAQGLPTTARLIEKFHTQALFTRDFPPDARLGAPPNEDPLNVIGQMTRRGLDPQLLRPVLDWLKDRPLERGLLAWDALSTTVIADDKLLEELRAAAAPYAEILPAPGRPCIDLNAHPAEGLIGRAHEKKDILELFALVNEHSLGALQELKLRNDKLVGRPGTLASLHAVGRLLHLAHAPTLSAMYLDYLSRALGFRGAARDLCEVMFDAGASKRLPADGVRPGDLSPELMPDFAEYLTYRAYLPLAPAKEIYLLFEKNLANRPPKRPPQSVQLQLVRAHLYALNKKGQTLGLEMLARICEENKLWRYAARVRVLVTGYVSPVRSPAPLAVLHDFVSAFGNDYDTVYDTLMVGPPESAWKQEILPLLVREARGLPHEASVWRSIIIMIGDQLGAMEAKQELQKKLEDQSRF